MNPDTERINARIARVGHWHHRIPIADGIVTPGVQDTDAVLAQLALRRVAHDRGRARRRRGQLHQLDHFHTDRRRAAAAARRRRGDVVVLDDVLDGAPVDVVKVDTQGVDHLVVRGLRRTRRASPRAAADGRVLARRQDERGIDAAGVLREFRALGRPVCVLGDDGVAAPAGDDEILAAAHASPVRFLNLVLGTAG